MPDEPDPDALYADARALARCASRLPPGEMGSRAQRFLTDCHALIAAAPRATLRKGYHRAAAAAALVGAAASMRADDRTSQWATAAEEHAQVAGDGPLLAELWLIRSGHRRACRSASRRPLGPGDRWSSPCPRWKLCAVTARLRRNAACSREYG